MVPETPGMLQKGLPREPRPRYACFTAIGGDCSMTDRPLTEREMELEQDLQRMREFRKEVTQTKESARQLLVEAGIYTKKGTIRKVHG